MALLKTRIQVNIDVPEGKIVDLPLVSPITSYPITALESSTTGNEPNKVPLITDLLIANLSAPELHHIKQVDQLLYDDCNCIINKSTNTIIRCDYEENDMGYVYIATNVSGKALNPTSSNDLEHAEYQLLCVVDKDTLSQIDQLMYMLSSIKDHMQDCFSS
jgi:hypothetical protein